MNKSRANLTQTPWKKKTCKQPHILSEIASFEIPLPLEFSLPSGGGGAGMDTFRNYTLWEKDEIHCFINLFSNLIYLSSQFFFF